jgi:hypothetical protein
MAKLSIEEATQKKIDAALKAERRRVAMALKEVPLPSFGSKKEANAFLKTVKAALAA